MRGRARRRRIAQAKLIARMRPCPKHGLEKCQLFPRISLPAQEAGQEGGEGLGFFIYTKMRKFYLGLNPNPQESALPRLASP